MDVCLPRYGCHARRLYLRGCAGCGRRCLCFACPSVCAGRPLPHSFFSFLSFFRMRKRENERKSGMLAGCFFMGTLRVFCRMLFFCVFLAFSAIGVCTHARPFDSSCCIFFVDDALLVALLMFRYSLLCFFGSHMGCHSLCALSLLPLFPFSYSNKLVFFLHSDNVRTTGG